MQEAAEQVFKPRPRWSGTMARAVPIGWDMQKWERAESEFRSHLSLDLNAHLNQRHISWWQKGILFFLNDEMSVNRPTAVTCLDQGGRAQKAPAIGGSNWGSLPAGGQGSLMRSKGDVLSSLLCPPPSPLLPFLSLPFPSLELMSVELRWETKSWRVLQKQAFLAGTGPHAPGWRAGEMKAWKGERGHQKKPITSLSGALAYMANTRLSARPAREAGPERGTRRELCGDSWLCMAVLLEVSSQAPGSGLGMLLVSRASGQEGKLTVEQRRGRAR